MIQKKIKPTTPSQRQTILFKNKLINNKFKRIRENYSCLGIFNYKSKLIKGFKRANGRNNQGKITVRHRGGGHKRLYRNICFKRILSSSKIKVESILYDPNRSANIAEVIDVINKKRFFIIAPEGLKEGDIIQNGSEASLTLGSSLPLFKIPIGSIIHNISLKPFEKARLIRSAGTSAQLLQKFSNNYAKIRLNSNEVRLIPLTCYASLGKVSNINHKKMKLGKAGRSRWLNKRPHVRGVAMNPVDHPHGGGEGKTSGGRPSVSPQGRITKGKPTRSKKKSNQFILETRKKKMSRNTKKAPFFKYNLINNQKKWIKIFNKNLVIMPKDVDINYNVYNGKTLIKLKITKDMLGYKFGEFINTRKKHIYKKTKKKNKWDKKSYRLVYD